jgi:hypothetical protein
VYVAATAFVFSVFFAYHFSINMNMTLNDPDVFWHLKMGEYVMEHKEVPDQDPFAFTSPVPLDRVQLIGLRAHWLGQVIFSLANKAKGLYGVVLLRNLLIIMPMIILLIWLLRRKVHPWEAFIVLSLPASMLSTQLFYSFERPQGLSFNLVLIVAILLERVRSKSYQARFDHSFWLLPLMTMLWANIHAGYIVGNIVIVIYMVSSLAGAIALDAREFLGDSWRKGGAGSVFATLFSKDLWAGVAGTTYRHVTRDKRNFFLVTMAALLSSGLNPNGYYLFANYASGLFNMFVRDVARYASGGGGAGWVQNVVLEYKPLYYFYVNLEYKWLVFYWGFTAMTFCILFVKYWLRRSVDLAEILTVTFVVLFANMYARGIMFSLTVMPLYLAKSLIDLKDDDNSNRLSLKVIVAVASILFVSFITYSYNRSPTTFKRGVPVKVQHKFCLMGGKERGTCDRILQRDRLEKSRPDRWITLWYPNYLSKFILANKPHPPMYNYYTWGGYLIYSLYPEYRVFIDGRAIDNRMTTTADNILKSRPSWKRSLDSGYGINFIAIPVIFRESGHIIPLATSLITNDDWSLVFLKNNGALFLRNRPIGSRSTMADWGSQEVSAAIKRNRQIIRRSNIDKKNIYREIIQLEEMFLAGSPNNLTYNISKADALSGLGQYRGAKAIYEKFAAHPEARQRLMRLKAMGY